MLSLRTTRERKLGPIITIKVIDENSASETFHVHENILCAKSDYFLKACQGSFKESATKEIELEEASADVFANFLEWIYFGNYAVATGKELDELFSVYIFADRVQASHLKNETIDKLISIEKAPERQRLSEDHIRLVFANTPSSSKLRDWVIRDAYYNDVKYFDDKFHGLSEDHPDFYFLLGGALAGVSNLPRTTLQRKSTYKTGVFPTCHNCHFHDHKNDAYCKYLETTERQQQLEREKQECIAGEVRKELEKEKKALTMWGPMGRPELKRENKVKIVKRRL